MLKADLANNDSKAYIYSPGFILYPTFFFLLPISLFTLLYILLRALQLQSDPEGMCHPRPGRQSFYDRRSSLPPHLTAWEDITVIAAMRGPNITLLTRFMGLFIASFKTLINNVSCTKGGVVKSFLYWNFRSATFPRHHP